MTCSAWIINPESNTCNIKRCITVYPNSLVYRKASRKWTQSCTIHCFYLIFLLHFHFLNRWIAWEMDFHVQNQMNNLFSSYFMYVWCTAFGPANYNRCFESMLLMKNQLLKASQNIQSWPKFMWTQLVRWSPSSWVLLLARKSDPPPQSMLVNVS